MKYDLNQLAQDVGIVFMGGAQLLAENARLRAGANGGMACDAQPALVTTSNSGIPALLSTFIDPKVITVLTAPLNAANIFSEAQKGDWTQETLMFNVVESTGYTSAYGDFSSSGRSGANANSVSRQVFRFQTVTEWGELELEREGLRSIDWVSQKHIASVIALNQYQNNTYFKGVTGLQLYGLLNDPNLVAAITPTTKTGGGTAWGPTSLPNEVNADILKLFRQLNLQMGGNLQMDTPMTLALSTLAMSYLGSNSSFSVNAKELIQISFPNLKFKFAPEYSTGGGELVQMIVDEFQGQPTADCVFTEKLRAHPVKTELSSFVQKKSQTTAGCVIYRPAAIAQMLGI